MLTIGIMINTRYENTRDHWKNLNKSYMIIIVFLFGFLFCLCPVFLLISDLCIHMCNKFHMFNNS